MTVSGRLKRVGGLLLPVLAASILISGSASADTFNQNRIIDDQIFDNTASMNSVQINSFLNQFPSSCISPNNGFQAPDPTGYSPSGGYTYGGNVSGGQVIADAAQAYGLNPQVILSTLQKEQSLVSGTAGCSTLRYTGAMGYGCPDGGTTYSYSGLNLYTINGSTTSSVSGTCVNTAAKAGFSQQVIHAAWLLKFGEQRSEGNINWNVQLTNAPQTGDHWDNSDDPQSCYGGPMTQGTFQVCPSGATTFYDGYRTIDSTSVHMDNGATASLYWYTPHFSGNQNFFTIFTGWFGPTLTAGFSWQYMSQGVYTDATKTTPQDPSQMVAGNRYYVTVQAKNVGTQTWTTNIVNLGTSQPQNRSSSFHDSTWPSSNRAATLDQGSIAPGATGSFSFWVTAPTTPGTYKEYFDPVADGYSWMNDMGLFWQFTVSPRHFTWQYLGQNAYTDQTMSTPADLSNAVPGGRYYLSLQIKNTGNMTWQNSYVNLGTSQPQNRSSSFRDTSWPSANRAAALDQASLAPGASGSFSFWVQAPLNQGGTFKEYFDPVADGQTNGWMNDMGLFWQFSLPTPQYSWQYLSQGVYTDQTMSTPADPSNLTHGSRYYLSLTIKNTGNAIWYPGNINLGTSQPVDRTSSFHDSTWPSKNRAATISQTSVPPNQSATFGFWITAPAATGTYKEYFDPVADGIRWFPDYGLFWQLQVH